MMVGVRGVQRRFEAKAQPGQGGAQLVSGFGGNSSFTVDEVTNPGGGPIECGVDGVDLGDAAGLGAHGEVASS